MVLLKDPIIAQEILQINQDHGFDVPTSWDQQDFLIRVAGLIVSELVEAMEELRQVITDPEHLAEEYADAAIRIWHVTAGMGLQLHYRSSLPEYPLETDRALLFTRVTVLLPLLTDMIRLAESTAPVAQRSRFLTVIFSQLIEKLYILSAMSGQDLNVAIDAKVEKNRNRPYKHGKAF